MIQSTTAPGIHKPLPNVPAQKPLPTPRPGSEESLGLPWRPFYLQWQVFLGFITTFLVMIACIEGLVSVSEANQGLGTSYQGLHYLWTYGPSAITTLVSLVWARVDCQAKLVAPWVHMSKGPTDAERTLLLDYISMFPILVLFRGVRNRDFLVAATTANTLICSILTIISTSLITLSPITFTDANAPITIQNIFVNDPTGLNSVGSLPSYFLHGLSNGNMALPDGSSESFAYETINSRQDAEVHTTLDGLSGSLDCVPAALDSYGLYQVLSDGTLDCLTLNLTFDTPDCVISVNRSYSAFAAGQTSLVNHTYVSRFVQGSCGGSADIEDQRIAILFGLLRKDLNYTSKNTWGTEHWSATMLKSSQLLCTPNYNISRVNLVQNGTESQTVTLSKSPSAKKLDNVHAWDFAQAFFNSFSGNTAAVSYPIQFEPVTISGEVINGDTVSRFAFRDSKALPKAASALLEGDYLESYMSKYYQKSIALIAHLSLMQYTSTSSTGTAISVENRLLVRPLGAHFMAGLLFLGAIFAVVACIMAPSQGLLPRAPTTLFGQATPVAQNHRILQRFRNLGGANSNEITAASSDYIYEIRFKSSNHINLTKPSLQTVFTVLDRRKQRRLTDPKPENMMAPKVHPFPLHPIFRAIMCIVMAGIIATLETTLRLSNTNAGLGNSADDTYLHYLWTALPATILSLLSVYLASVDFGIRSLLPFHFMKTKTSAPIQGASFAKSIGLDLLDRSLPSALSKELRIGAHAGYLATITLLVSHFLAIFTSPLFLADTIPTSSLHRLATKNSLTASPSELAASLQSQINGGGYDASLVLVGNLSYPAFTYEDLIMPGLTLPPDFAVGNETGTSNASWLLFNATIPAIRPKLTCEVYNSSHIAYQLLEDNLGDEELIFTVDDDLCQSPRNPNNTSGSFNLLFSGMNYVDVPEIGYFAWAGSTSGTVDIYNCSQWFYIWGHIDRNADPNITSVSAMVCNETTEGVDVTASFIGTSLVIDPANPPRPIEGSTRATTASILNDGDYGQYNSLYPLLANVTYPDNPLVNPFFVMLTSSRYALPLSALGDPAQTQSVTDAIRFQHGVMRAVYSSATYRVPANATNATLGAAPPAGATDNRTYEVTVTDPRERRRVIQDAASTRVLQALLTAILVMSIAAWVLMPDTALLPRAPGSIAGAVALLAGGDFFDHLPKNAEWLSDEELEAHFRDIGVSGFCMGQGVLENGEKCLKIYPVRDGSCVAASVAHTA